ncbi:hypothetical protein CSW98_06005 [Vibrio sp. HA2012]|uniref:hypothetical protein n=1 Tax=Vibrio sp. HA2012 TaxID=1971595 RepID=UPI000C2BDA6A|nr:hypothetical protein [Vibrio sp. HA2012]PJC87447.1 hypothetical protein CSW98_06005 [Vibrio sp. HA2012]
MAQVMHANRISAPTSTDKKTYAVNVKGLIAHLLDVLFVQDSVESHYYSSDLSGHLQKDIGLIR